MIYLNHAGTSWPKPAAVVTAANAILAMSPADWPEEFAAAHETVADFFHVPSSRLLLTPSCTAALHLAVQDHDWQAGDRVLTSHFEHHALHRALVNLKGTGVEVTTLPFERNELIQLDELEHELKRGSVKMVALTAACNVTGRLMPLDAAISLAHRYGAITLVDGAQIAGWWDLDVPKLGADLFTFAGHKGPQAPWGIGGLYVNPNLPMSCPTAVCDINASTSRLAAMPGYCEAGSVNLSALAGMAAACDWLSETGQLDRLSSARSLAAAFADGVKHLPAVTTFHDVPPEGKVPTVAISTVHPLPANLGEQLRARGVIASAGFQCAPRVHQALGTEASGLVRFSFGPSNHDYDVEAAVGVLSEIMTAS